MLTVTILAAAIAAAAPAPPAHPSTVAFEIAERDLLPESIAYDPGDGSFYVGSMHRRKIVRIAADGKVGDFKASKQDGLWTVIGIKADPKKRELWATSCNLRAGERPPMIDPEPETAGQAALHRYDLRSGKLLARYVAAGAPAALCFNDLVLSAAGDVYLTSGMDGLWRLRAGGEKIERFLAVPDDFVNGIDISPDGRTLFVAAHVAGVSTVDVTAPAMKALPVPPGPHLRGIDGLYLHRNALIGVQNGTAKQRIVRAPLNEDRSAATAVEILDEENPKFAVPTTGVLVGDSLYYVATSQLDAVDPKTNVIAPVERLKPNLILKLDLPK